MTNKDNGGPAFPETGERGKAAGGEGMTLRDYFAAKAMTECLRSLHDDEGVYPDEHWRVGVAMEAYAMADAMLEARKQ